MGETRGAQKVKKMKYELLSNETMKQPLRKDNVLFGPSVDRAAI